MFAIYSPEAEKNLALIEDEELANSIFQIIRLTTGSKVSLIKINDLTMENIIANHSYKKMK